MGIPVQYDEFGRPISPRFAETKPPVDAPQVREWLSGFKEGFREFSEEMGCEADIMLLVMAGFLCQDVFIVADAIDRNVRWVGPRVERLRKMDMWQGGTTLGPRFNAWYAAMGDDDTTEIGPELYVPVLLDILEIDGKVESERDASGELRFWKRKT